MKEKSVQLNIDDIPYPVITDMEWQSSVNIAGRKDYETQYSGLLRRASTQGVAHKLAKNAFLIGALKKESVYQKDQKAISLALELKLELDKILEIKDATVNVYLVDIGNNAVYVLITQMSSIIYDALIDSPEKYGETEIQQITDIIDDCLLSATPIIAIDWIGSSSLQSSKTEDLAICKKKIEEAISELVESQTGKCEVTQHPTLTLNTILAARDRKALSFIHDISAFPKNQGSTNPKLLIALAVVIVSSGWWMYDSYTTNLANEKLKEQRQAQHLGEAKRLAKALTTQIPTINPSVSEKTPSELIEDEVTLERQWIEQYLTHVDPNQIDHIRSAIENIIVEVNGWNAQNAVFVSKYTTFPTPKRDNIVKLTLTKNAEYATAQDVVAYYQDAIISLDGLRAEVSKVTTIAQSTQNTKQIPKFDAVEVVSVAQRASQTDTIEQFVIQPIPMFQRPRPQSEDFIKLYNASHTAQIGKETWLYAIERYQIIITGRYTSALTQVKELQKQLAHYMPILSSVSYDIGTQAIKAEVIIHAKN
ncbi:hypothetical protein QTV44_002598 [Vibrio vulnificus]|nr:hypothetical protein [Vibrio vulnificus]